MRSAVNQKIGEFRPPRDSALDFGNSLVAQLVKNLPAVQETWVRSLGQEDSPGEGNGNPFQYACLGNPMDRGPWQAAVHGVTKSWTRLSDEHFHFHIV